MSGKRDIEAAGAAPVLLALAAAAVLLTGCDPGADDGEAPPDTTATEDTVPERTIQQVMGEHGNRWMLRSVVTGMGVGQCDGEPCIVVYLARELEEDDEPFPDSVEGYEVRTEVVGRVIPRGGGGPDDDDG